MNKSKKKNPKYRPATEADVRKAERRGREQGAHLMFACILTSIKDMHMISNDELSEMWDNASMLAEEINKGHITLQDLDGVLADEYDCHWIFV